MSKLQGILRVPLRGRGIALMAVLSDAVTTSTGDEGTTVVLHWQLRS
ncbi:MULTISPECIES: ATP-binding protein [Gordonia]|nr:MULTISPECIES: hypothetical protein [unclassified Gordonia (in: high G+C Gram-positive bacteria)]